MLDECRIGKYPSGNRGEISKTLFVEAVYLGGGGERVKYSRESYGLIQVLRTEKITSPTFPPPRGSAIPSILIQRDAFSKLICVARV